MLCLSLRKNERVFIGDIEIKILKTGQSYTRILIDADKVKYPISRTVIPKGRLEEGNEEFEKKS